MPAGQVKIAYIVLAHQLPSQLARLVGALDSPHASFLVHVNRRAGPRMYEQMRDGLAKRENVRFIRRHRLHWGGFGHVAATLEGIEELYRSQLPSDYVFLLTGQDYPIKSNDHIERVLAESDANSFLAYDRLPGGWENGMDRITYWHWRTIGRPRGWHIRLPLRREFPSGFRPFGGSSYWCLARPCVDYVRAFVEANPSFVRFFRHVDVPDEIFFHTILMNSELAGTILNDDLRYVDWTRRPLPAVLAVGDLTSLAASTKLFARKFDVRVDADVLDRIDAELRTTPAAP